jgi:hypothetical protein
MAYKPKATSDSSYQRNVRDENIVATFNGVLDDPCADVLVIERRRMSIEFGVKK